MVEFIKLSRRSLELVRSVSGALLVIYVTVLLLSILLPGKSFIDKDSGESIRSLMEIPTGLALVVFSGISIKLYINKPKYRVYQRNKSLIDTSLLLSGTGFILLLLYLKYGI